MNDHDHLSETLHRRAALGAPPGAEHPISLEDVQHRARGIRRRRAAGSGLAVAAVLAVAVPVGLSAADRATDGPGRGPAGAPTAHATPDGTPSADPTASVLPDATRKVLLTTQVEASSGPPGLPYLRGGVVLTPDGDEVTLGPEYAEFAASGDGWVGLDVSEGRADVLDADGVPHTSVPGRWPLAVSPDGSVVAFGSDDGTIRTVVDAGEPQLFRTGEGPAEVAGVTDGCADQSDAECMVYFTVEGQTPFAAWYAGPAGGGRLPLKAVESMSPNGVVAGFTSITDTGSCSAIIEGPEEHQAWRTCDHSLGAFSPDGELVIGHPAYRSGVGDGTMAIIVASTGRVLVEFENSMESQAFVGDVAWETESTLLATVYERGSWSVMRMTVGGELTEVFGDVGTDETQPPVIFAARP